MALFLGLDLSTQSLKSTVTNADAQIISEQSVNFHRDLPKYGTHHGGIAGPDGEITTPVALWLESLDIVLQGLASAGVDFNKIVAVAGAAQVCTLWSLLRAQATYQSSIATRQRLLEQARAILAQNARSQTNSTRAAGSSGLLPTKRADLARLVYYR